MKQLYFIILAVLLNSACEKEEIRNPYVSESVDAIVDALENAYSHNSKSEYKAILDNWHNNIPPKPFDSLDKEIEKDIYKIFQVLYNPFDISRLGEHEWGNLYEGYDYAVVQNTILYNFSYEIENYEECDTLSDFRPEISLDGKTILYLEPNYHKAIYIFLGAEFNPLGTGGIMNPASPTGETQKRLEFLWKYLAIIPGHWGGYYHIETHPDVSMISFNESVDKARVYFRVGYMFGEAEFEKNRSGWVMIHSAITGIEK
jgi:hypothetical protein